MTTSLPPVARNIHVFCKKCDTERYFKVITHTSATTAKLKCEVCGCSRNYSLDEGKMATSPVVKKPRAKKATSTKGSASATWLTLKEKYSGPAAVPYAISVEFKNQQSLLHPTFGEGFVTKSNPYKIEVVFAEGIKELMHAKK